MVITGKDEALLIAPSSSSSPCTTPMATSAAPPYNRINQNGPEQMGWRGNARNINLNRDYMKADAPETRAFMAMFHHLLPDFFVDDHVTDGADFQYDVTFTIEHFPNLNADIGQWLDSSVIPDSSTRSTQPAMSPRPPTSRSSTNLILRARTSMPSSAAFRPEYMNLENRPSMLVEMPHMLEDDKTRVTGN